MILRLYKVQGCCKVIFELTLLQQGLEIHGFWFQKKTVQRKTVLREVYTYVVKYFFFKKPCNFKAFVQNPRIPSVFRTNSKVY